MRLSFLAATLAVVSAQMTSVQGLLPRIGDDHAPPALPVLAPSPAPTTTPSVLPPISTAPTPSNDSDIESGPFLRGANNSIAEHLRANTSVAEQPSASKALGEFYAAHDDGLTPDNMQDDGHTVSLTVRPNQEAVRCTSPGKYTRGRFEFRGKSASQMPGVITAVYLASGKGRTGDSTPGDQDEIDIEWKGNTPTQIQTNVYLSGSDQAQVKDLGFDTSKTDTTYAIDWDEQEVRFFVNGDVIRTVPLSRPLKPMTLELSVWTTMGGWPGLIQWAGFPDWNGRGSEPVTATFEIMSVPSQ